MTIENVRSVEVKAMSMMRRDPFDALTPLREAMNRLFEESFVGPRLEAFSRHTFPLDIYESKDKQYVVEAALPGLKSEDIQITAEGNVLSIHTEKKEGRERFLRTP
jgi:HSP20 family protein